LAARQQRLSIILNKLSRLAEVHNIAVIITNQVQSQPDDFSVGLNGSATGGNIMVHASTHRTLLRKAGSTRIAIMMMTYHAHNSIRMVRGE